MNPSTLQTCVSQCASCPFRGDNDKEFKRVVSLLRESLGIPGKTSQAHVAYARAAIKIDTAENPRFACHATVYELSTGKMKPVTDRKQCPGAIDHYSAFQKQRKENLLRAEAHKTRKPSTPSTKRHRA